VYCNPRWGEEERNDLFRQITWITEQAVCEQAGFNHCIIAGDLNANGLPPLWKLLEVRGYKRLNLDTRGTHNLDEVFYSPGLHLHKAEANYVAEDSIKLFDHAAIAATFTFQVCESQRRYTITKPLTTMEIKKRLGTKTN